MAHIRMLMTKMRSSWYCLSITQTTKKNVPDEVPPNRPVPAAGCPVLVAAPVPPPKAVHYVHKFTLNKL